MVALMIVAKGKEAPVEIFDLSQADAADKECLEGIWYRYMLAVTKHILIGSWSGLVIAGSALVVVAIRRILKGRGNVHESVVKEVQRDISLEPTLRVLAEERRGLKQLSASV